MTTVNDQKIAVLDELTALAQARAAAGAIAGVTATLPITSSGGATPNIAINPATDSTAGSMSAADKTKLDGITPGAGIDSITGTAPIGVTSGSTPVVSIAAATDGAAGSMSASDKTKLDGITAGAAVASVGVTAPIVNTGSATAPVIGITPGAASVVQVANAAALTALSVTGLPIGALAFCGVPGASTPSFCAYFTLESSTGLTTDGVTVIASSSGALFWVRLITGVAALTALQTAWFVDSANTSTTASDENTGLTSGTALRTKAEIVRRWGTNSPTLNGINVVITYLSTEAAGGNDPGNFSPNFLNKATLTHTCALPASSFTGTLLAVTAKNTGSGNSSLQSTFTVVTGAVAANMLLVNTTRGNSRAFAQRIISGGNWQLSQPMTPWTINTGYAATEVNTWANGDAIIGYTLTSIDLANITGLTVETNSTGTLGSHIVYNLDFNSPNGGFDACVFGDKCNFKVIECSFHRSIQAKCIPTPQSLFANCCSFATGLVSMTGDGVETQWVAGVLQGTLISLPLLSFNIVSDAIVLPGAAGIVAGSNIVFTSAFLDGGTLSLYGQATVDNVLYGTGGINVVAGSLLLLGTSATASLRTSGAIKLNGLTTGYSNVTAAGVVTVHGGITVNGTNLDAAAGAAGFGGYAFGGGATISFGGLQP